MIKKILITAGPTREMLDPVRFISNLSTGQMGYTLAEKAHLKGYQVTLITGPTSLTPPRGVKVVDILSANDLRKACQKYFPKHDALIMTAAVCDFTSSKASVQKIHRSKGLRLQLKQTSDIVSQLAKKKGKRKVIGFCLETEDWLSRAKRKLKKKHLDGIVANYASSKHIPFGDRSIDTAFIDRKGKVKHLKKKTKRVISGELLKWMERL